MDTLISAFSSLTSWIKIPYLGARSPNKPRNIPLFEPFKSSSIICAGGFDEYYSRFKTHLQSHGIMEDDKDESKTIFLSSNDGFLQELTKYLAAPKKLEDLSFDEIIDLLKKNLGTKPGAGAEQLAFEDCMSGDEGYKTHENRFDAYLRTKGMFCKQEELKLIFLATVGAHGISSLPGFQKLKVSRFDELINSLKERFRRGMNVRTANDPVAFDEFVDHFNAFLDSKGLKDEEEKVMKLFFPTSGACWVMSLCGLKPKIFHSVDMVEFMEEIHLHTASLFENEHRILSDDFIPFNEYVYDLTTFMRNNGWQYDADEFEKLFFQTAGDILFDKAMSAAASGQRIRLIYENIINVLKENVLTHSNLRSEQGSMDMSKFGDDK